MSRLPNNDRVLDPARVRAHVDQHGLAAVAKYFGVPQTFVRDAMKGDEVRLEVKNRILTMLDFDDAMRGVAGPDAGTHLEPA